MTVLGRKIGSVCIALLIPAALSGCSSGSAGLTTGTLLGGSPTTATPAAAVIPETPMDRAFHVGSISARAERCGYVFDPGAVRSGYLASESQSGTPPDQFAKAQQHYDNTVATVKKVVAGEADYCDEERTAAIKRDLNAILAGNYAAPVKRAAPKTTSWWGSPSSSNDTFDRNKALHPGRPY